MERNGASTVSTLHQRAARDAVVTLAAEPTPSEAPVQTAAEVAAETTADAAHAAPEHRGPAADTATGPNVLPGYRDLTIPQLRGRLRHLAVDDLQALLDWETAHDNRPPFVTMLSNRITTVNEGCGRGGALFVSGPAGIGKTSLLRWIDQRAEERGLRSGVGTSASIEGAWPYAPVLEALADLCRRQPALTRRPSRRLPRRDRACLARTSRNGTARVRHQRLFVSAAELLRLAPPGLAPSSSSTTPTTRTRPVFACSTICRRLAVKSGWCRAWRTVPGRYDRRWTPCAAA